ncbi:MAG: cbb3-type cytochrome c oxidase subunit I, partial [Candidatus Acidiferrum sp.]
AILGALFFWFPKMFARRLNETLGKLHFWLTFAGVYCVFMPMHWLGLMARSRAAIGDFATIAPLATLPETPLGVSLRTLVTVATILTVSAQALFLFNFIWSLWRGEKTEDPNPWRATTLEWSVPSPAPLGNFGASEPIVYRGAYEFIVSGAAEDFAPQGVVPFPSDPTPQTKQAAKAGAKEN